GRSAPLGATIRDGGVNFSIFSRNATAIELLLFDGADDAEPSRVISLDRTYHYWHQFVPGVERGQVYGFRADGPSDPSNGLRFDASKTLLDPYGRGVAVPKNYHRFEGTGPLKSVVVDTSTYDWEDDRPPRHPSARSIIY